MFYFCNICSLWWDQKSTPTSSPAVGSKFSPSRKQQCTFLKASRVKFQWSQGVIPGGIFSQSLPMESGISMLGFFCFSSLRFLVAREYPFPAETLKTDLAKSHMQLLLRQLNYELVWHLSADLHFSKCMVLSAYGCQGKFEMYTLCTLKTKGSFGQGLRSSVYAKQSFIWLEYATGPALGVCVRCSRIGCQGKGGASLYKNL